VFNTYGEYGNAKLLSCYAFSLPANIFDAVRMPPLAAAAAAAIGARAVRARARWIRGILRAGPVPDGGGGGGGGGCGISRAARVALRRALSAAERGWMIKARYKQAPPPLRNKLASVRASEPEPTLPPLPAYLLSTFAAPPAVPAQAGPCIRRP
jgi:hypothetical protein